MEESYQWSERMEYVHSRLQELIGAGGIPALIAVTTGLLHNMHVVKFVLGEDARYHFNTEPDKSEVKQHFKLWLGMKERLQFEVVY